MSLLTPIGQGIREIYTVKKRTVPSGPARRTSIRMSPIHGRGVFATRDLALGVGLFESKGTGSSRWINHSCAPNCMAEDRQGRDAIRTIRPIFANEELTLDYALVVKPSDVHVLRLKYACYCGAVSCRGTMLASWTLPDTVPPTSSAPEGVPREQYVSAVARVFERVGPDALIASWREPGRCCYSEQRWERFRAPFEGQCALTGAAYIAGDFVFRPIGRPPPLNCTARIAETSLSGTIHDSLAFDETTSVLHDASSTAK